MDEQVDTRSDYFAGFQSDCKSTSTEIAEVGTVHQAITQNSQEARSQLMLIEQNRLLKSVASGTAFEDCLAACDAIARLSPGIRACFLLTDAQRQSFERSTTPDLPGSFGQGLEGAPINDLCIGTCGEAVYRNQPIATIERSAKLQSELIEDLLDVSCILQGKLSLNVSAVNCVSIIHSAIETVRLAAEAKFIPIKTTLAEVGQVSGDATRLQQVVWNLLSNAVKFTPAGGEITVRLKSVGDQTLISVTDTGKGINPNFLPYVFDSFRQEDGVTTRKFGGLGLAIVHRLVELHGGIVEAISAGEEQGMTFTVKLCLMAMHSTLSQTTDDRDRCLGLSGIQILVVDDEPDSRDFITFVLEQAGAQVKTAVGAGEAFALLTHAQFDVLLSDTGMPEMDGYRLMQQVRALSIEQFKQICAIALTAYAGDFNQRQALQARFQKHLAKPIEPEVLVREVAALVKDKQ